MIYMLNEQNITKLIEEFSYDNLQLLSDAFITFAYIILACFFLYFLAKVIPAIIDYKAIKYIEVRITKKKEKGDKPLLIKAIENRKKKNKEL